MSSDSHEPAPCALNVCLLQRPFTFHGPSQLWFPGPLPVSRFRFMATAHAQLISSVEPLEIGRRPRRRFKRLLVKLAGPSIPLDSHLLLPVPQVHCLYLGCTITIATLRAACSCPCSPRPSHPLLRRSTEVLLPVLGPFHP